MNHPAGDPPTPQRLSPSFILAEEDVAFLARPELRPVRLQLELLKPEMLLQEQGVVSTIVVFGSARTPAPEEADRMVGDAEKALSGNPGSSLLKQKLAGARKLKEKVSYYQEARKFAALVSSRCQVEGKCDHVVVTGGGPGIMEAANRGANEMGAVSIGLNITLPHEQQPNPYISPKVCFNFHYFAMRKMHFLMRAKALVCFPGGFGTLDELFDALTLIQTGKMQPIPVLLFGQQFWKRIVNFEALVEEGTISPEDLDLFEYVDTAEEAWERIAAFHGI